jgi:chaperonin GroES
MAGGPDYNDDNSGIGDHDDPKQEDEIESQQQTLDAGDATLPEPTASHARDEDQHLKLMKWIASRNIAAELDDSVLGEIGQRVHYEYHIDHDSRSDWMTKSRKAMELAMQVADTKQYPWPKASNVVYPLMTTASIQFAARAYPAIVSNRNVVKGIVWGDDNGIPLTNAQGMPIINPQTNMPMFIEPPGAKRDRSTRIGEHMSWQLLDEQSEWEEETDKLMHILPIAGCCFRKTYFDPSMGRNMSVLVTAPKLVINYYAKSMETAPRITEEVLLYPVEIEEYERAGLFREIQYTQGHVEQAGDEDAPQEFLEQHRWWDLDDDGYPEPYVVTIHKHSSQVVRIVARYDHDSIKFRASDGEVVKIDPIHYYTKYDFLPNPEGGIYGVGFGQLLRPVNEAINTSLNMLIDAGHLAVTGGGFIGKGLSMHAGNIRFMPGEYKPVNATGATVKDNIVPLSFPGPSPVLFQLLGTLIEAGKEIAAVKDVLTGEQKDANIPATTTLALIEQGLKVFTAIYKRIHRSLKAELAKLYRLNSLYLPDAGAGYRVNNEWRSISRQDYMKGSGVEPVSDPSMVSDMQKLGRAQFLMSFANDPWFNGLAVRRRMLDAAMIEKVDELLVPSLPPNPEMMEKTVKLEQASKRTDAEALKNMAQAVLFITQADAVLGDQHLGWAQHQLAALKTEIEALQNGQQGGTEGGAGNNGGGLQGVAPPSGNKGPVPLPPGLQGGTGTGGSQGNPSGQ